MNYNEFREKYNVKLTKQQEDAVRSVEGNVLLLAVPGSGKTTVLVTRLAWMTEGCAIPPGNILTMTYTVAATNDMKRRYCELFGKCAVGTEFRTINSVCCEVIRFYEKKKGAVAFLLAEEKERIRIISSVFREVNGEYALESDLQDVSTAITYAKNMMLSEDEIGKMRDEGKTDVENFLEIFRKYKTQMNCEHRMDFDDQLCYARTILRRYPDILEEFRNKYRYICLDEAQDTSRIQHEIISLLAGENGNLFMVGDEDQSIYAFRAAYPDALADFEKTRKNAKVLYMEENFRSTAIIAAVADAFISQNQLRHEKHMYASRTEEGRPVCQIPVRERKEQYDFLLENAVPEARGVNGGKPVQTAVLYRDNSSALPLIDTFLRNGIPYSGRGLETGFFSSRIVKDVSDIIRFAENPADRELFLAVYYKINTYIDRKNALLAAELCDGQTDIPTWLYKNAPLKEGVKRRQFVLKRQLEELKKLSGDAAIDYIDTELGYGKYLEREKMKRNGLEILRLLGEKESTPGRLLERLGELEESIRAGSAGGKYDLILSTIHSAKGLEYERVYLLDVMDGILPQCAGSGTIEQMEEERRLFYVGMTRAKNELFIFRCKKSSCPSVFSDYVFGGPPEEQKRETNSAARTERKKKNGTGRESLTFVSPAVSAQEIGKYIPGVAVFHSSFGNGVIESVNDDMIATVSFRKKGKKNLYIPACVEKGILRVL